MSEIYDEFDYEDDREIDEMYPEWSGALGTTFNGPGGDGIAITPSGRSWSSHEEEAELEAEGMDCYGSLE